MLILLDMPFSDQNGFDEERAGKKEKRDLGPALQTQLSTSISIAKIKGLSKVIF
jgi:hypothetical protein